MTIQTDVAGRFFAFMLEREAVRLRRVAGRPWPWTEDPILQKYSFTNVKREHDRTSRLLREEFYQPHYDDDPQLILLNCAIARYIGTIEFMRALGWQTTFKPKHIKTLIRDRLDAKQRVYTGAYLISPCNNTGPKEAVVVDIFLADLWRQRREICDFFPGANWQALIERMQQVQGFGGTSFMAKEISLDTRYTGAWPRQPDDRFTWTPVGPGSKRGAARILGHTDDRALSGPATLQVCRELFAIRGDYLPPDFIELELHDVQFQLCEFSKREKVSLGQGRPRSLYRRPN